MAKPTTMRLPEDLKEALAKAAENDQRSQSSMLIKIVSDWLKSNGYLKVKGKAR